jgi:ribonuclease E
VLPVDDEVVEAAESAIDEFESTADAPVQSGPRFIDNIAVDADISAEDIAMDMEIDGNVAPEAPVADTDSDEGEEAPRTPRRNRRPSDRRRSRNRGSNGVAEGESVSGEEAPALASTDDALETLQIAEGATAHDDAAASDPVDEDNVAQQEPAAQTTEEVAAVAETVAPATISAEPAPALEPEPEPEPIVDVAPVAPTAPVIPALAGRAPNDPREIKRRQMLEAAQKQQSEE